MTNMVDLSNYHLTFDAEMTTAADISKFNYSFTNGDRTLYNNNEAQYYVDYDPTQPNNPFSFANGALTINARPTPAGVLPYTSGLLQTADTFTQSEGYFEIRAETPSAHGFWSAFWMLSTDGPLLESDILEQPNNSGSASEYWFHIATPTVNGGYYTDTGVNLASGYHSYGFKWDSSTISYYFDGKSIGYSHATPVELHGQEMYLLANLAVGGAGSWPGQPASGASAAYNIDYIRAYSTDPTKPAVALDPISSPDGVNTAPALTDTLPSLGSVPTPVFGQGPDVLVLRMSEDAYAGDAQFTILVDGVQQGGVLTTTASHATGQFQAFTVLGSYGSSAHTVTVNFLNDAYGGSADKDRNLYVSGATINDVDIPGSVVSAEANGSHSFKFGTIPGVTIDLVYSNFNTGITSADALNSMKVISGSFYNDSLRGDAEANTLVGQEGVDFLDGREGSDGLIGGAGNDFLIGGEGIDALYGGTGADTFYYRSLAESDYRETIGDFQTGEDHLQLVRAGFSDQLNLGALDPNRFVVGDGPTHGFGQFIYNSAGNLFWDADGTGSGGAVSVVTLAGHPAFAASDILIV